MSGPLASRTFPLVLAAPSGAGKTSIARRLRERREDVVFSVSATTRPPRPGERDGVDYHFVTEPEFRRMIAAGELIEWAEVHGRLYGTPAANVRAAVEGGLYVVLDIDVQGAEQIRAHLPDAVHVFILPPTADILCERLTGRGSEDAETLTRRLRNAGDEVRGATRFDYMVVNDDLESAVDDVERILTAESLRTARIPALAARIAAMCADIEGYLAKAGR